MDELYCPLSFPQLETFFDFSFAPTLLFYAYIPIALVSVFFGLFILSKNTRQPQSQLLFALSLVFALLLCNEIVQWITVYARVVHLGWELSAFFHSALVYLIVYFTWTYFKGSALSFKQNLGLVLSYAPIIALLPTEFNMIAFDIINCEAINGPLWYYIYALEFTSIVFVGYLAFYYARKTTDSSIRKQIWMLSAASAFFLLVFTLTNFAGDIFLVYEVNLIGPIGMALFLSFLAYMIVRYHAFSVKVIGAQMLVIALAALVFAMLFVRHIENLRYVIAITFLLVMAIGAVLVKSVKREVALREQLEIMNKQQVDTMRFITHEVKGYLTDSSGAFDALLTNTFGPINDETRAMVQEALNKDQKAINEIKEFLRISDFKTGRVAYQMQPFDFKASLESALPMLEENAKKKGLELKTNVAPGSYTVKGDQDQLTNHVIGNLINNATNYTPGGAITVSLSRSGNRIVFSVKDTGVGLTEDDKKVLFTEGGRGSESRNINPHSTGYGLFIAHKIVGAHRGRIWAESEGRGKGSTFFVELPALS
ncbi:MAG: hypothetical protein AMXMBFR44_1730 [Candidatus Campbellbacteria bacterium]